jgi:acyl carrier protein
MFCRREQGRFTHPGGRLLRLDLVSSSQKRRENSIIYLLVDSAMDNPGNTVAAIYRAIDCINAELPPDRQLGKTPDTRLLGSQSVLDSLHLVSLLITIEREVEDTIGVTLTLADERALSMKESPFRTVESLASYIEVLIREAQNG